MDRPRIEAGGLYAEALFGPLDAPDPTARTSRLRFRSELEVPGAPGAAAAYRPHDSERGSDLSWAYGSFHATLKRTTRLIELGAPSKIVDDDLERTSRALTSLIDNRFHDAPALAGADHRRLASLADLLDTREPARWRSSSSPSPYAICVSRPIPVHTPRVRRFFVREGRLRLGFRLFLFVVLFDLAQLLALPLSIDRAGPAFVVLSFGIAGGLVRGAAVVGVVYALRRFVDRRDFASIGLDARPRRSLDAAFGFAIGAVAIVAVFAIETGAGWTSIIGWEVHPSVLVATLVAFFGGALAEEAAIRGYVYQNLAESGPVWRGALITGLLFAVLHAYVEGFGLGALFGFVAFTAFLVVTRIVSGSLWFAIGFHTSWNWMQDAVLGLSNVDEPDFGRALVHLEQRGPSWLVGDAPMIEGGAIAVAVLALLLVAALIYLRRAQSQSSSSQSSPSSPSAERERS